MAGEMSRWAFARQTKDQVGIYAKPIAIFQHHLEALLRPKQVAKGRRACVGHPRLNLKNHESVR